MSRATPVALLRLPTADQVRAVRTHYGCDRMQMAGKIKGRVHQFVAAEGGSMVNVNRRTLDSLVRRFAWIGVTFPNEHQVDISDAGGNTVRYNVQDHPPKLVPLPCEEPAMPTTVSKLLKRAVTFKHGLNDDFFTHQSVWLAAMDRLIELEPVTGEPDDGERLFWQRERDIMAFTFNHLNDQVAKGYEMVGPSVADDIQRLNHLEDKARESYTGLSVVKEGAHGLKVMWYHHLGTPFSTLRQAIDFEFPKQVVSNVEDRDTRDDWMVESIESRVKFADQPVAPVKDADMHEALATVAAVEQPAEYWPALDTLLDTINCHLDTLDMRKKEKRKLLGLSKEGYKFIRQRMIQRPTAIDLCTRLRISFNPPLENS